MQVFHLVQIQVGKSAFTTTNILGPGDTLKTFSVFCRLEDLSKVNSVNY